MKLNKLSILGFALVSMLFTNCNNNEDTVLESEAKFETGKPVSRIFKGVIVDQNNAPLSNVTIRMSGKTTTTDQNGQFSMSNVTVLERFAYMTTEKAGFIDGSRAVSTHTGINSVRLMMLPADVLATILTGAPQTVSLPNNTKVSFDGSFVSENGTAYNGQVKVVINHLDSADPFVFDKMPGSLLALNSNGDYRGLETYGMINVELLSATNQKLQIAPGHKAKLTMPIASNQLDTAPASIPLWHFDVVSGLWKEEGSSKRVGNIYVGEVSHFSWWNNDEAFVVGTLNVSVKYADETPVQGVKVTITRMNGSTGDVLMDLGVTNSNGLLSSPVPLNEQYVTKIYSNGVMIYNEPQPASNQMIRNIDLILQVDIRP